MFKEKSKTISKRITATIFITLFCVLPGCVAPEAVKMELATIKDNFSQLKRLIENKADTKIITDVIDNFKQEINQNLFNMNKTLNNSGSIVYGGGGWIVVGTGIIVLIFVGAGLLLIRAFMKRGNMLSMLTRAVKTAGEESPETVRYIKQHLKKCVDEGYYFEQDKCNLGKFAKKVGNFTEQK